MVNPEPAQPADVAADLVTAMLSVNAWPLEKTWKLHPALEREGLFDLSSLQGLERAELFDRLQRAGYKRGDYLVGLIVDRIRDLVQVLGSGGLDELCSLLQSENTEHLDSFLLRINGIGPTVLRNFKVLRGIQNE